jgi:5-methylcytosine-specific restriction protein A
MGKRKYTISKALRPAVLHRRSAGVPHQRSPHWEAVRDAHIKAHPKCAVCSGSQSLEVHHVVPFHIEPALELVSSNLLTMCDSPQKCHLLVGHLGNWRRWNKNVLQDIAKPAE